MAGQCVFGCEFGLSQDDCGKYEKDEKSRGAGRWDGCPSCSHREPANAETRQADDAWFVNQQLPE